MRVSEPPGSVCLGHSPRQHG